MEVMTLGPADGRHSITAAEGSRSEAQYVSLRVEEAKTSKSGGGAELQQREKGEGRVIVILFMNG